MISPSEVIPALQPSRSVQASLPSANLGTKPFSFHTGSTAAKSEHSISPKTVPTTATKPLPLQTIEELSEPRPKSTRSFSALKPTATSPPPSITASDNESEDLTTAPTMDNVENSRISTASLMKALPPNPPKSSIDSFSLPLAPQATTDAKLNNTTETKTRTSPTTFEGIFGIPLADPPLSTHPTKNGKPLMPPPARPFAGFFRLTANDVAEFIGQATDKTKSYPVRSLMEVAQISRDEILDYLNHLYIVVTPVTLARDILAQEISEAEQVLADEDILAAFYERTGQDRNLLKTVVRLNEAGLKTLNTYINPVINEMVKLMDEKWRRVRRGDWREEGADERIAGMMERLKRGDLVVHREGEGSELGV